MNNRRIGILSTLAGIMMIGDTYAGISADVSKSAIGVKQKSKIQYSNHSFTKGKRHRSQKSRSNRRRK